MPSTKKQPIDRIRLGTVQAAIWKNTDDEGRPWYAVTLERLYRDGENKWKSTSSFGRDELLSVAKVADLANTRIHELVTADREERESESESAEPDQQELPATEETAPDNGRARATKAAKAAKARARTR